ncbi:MAG: BtpA/SgcQ family protein [Acidimicrobiia bacterium]
MIGPLIGMVHLGPLPGAPRFDGDFDAIVKAAVADARTLVEAGFDALLVENYGDAPFFADDVPKVTVAAMTRAVAAIRGEVSLPVGVNVLRNDGPAALAVAAATGAQFIRVNVLTGSMSTDQGLITGRAAELARLRSSLGSGIRILADVFVKHAVPPPGLTIEQAARDTFDRGPADALVITGSATGRAPATALLERVRTAVPKAPLLAGSGATADTVGQLLETCDGVIVGTAIKVGGVTTQPVDPERADSFVRAARSGKSGSPQRRGGSPA